MTRRKKLIMWTILLVALIQMPTLAVTPAVGRIYADVFPDRPLAAIQASMSLTGMVSPFSSLLMAALIRRGVLSKRAVVATGLLMLGSCGALAVVLRGYFWCIALLGALIGFAAGCYISTTTSVLVDCFEGPECRRLAGLQAIFMGVGGAALSVSCGFLVNFVWYGGYLVLSVGIPIGVFALATLPRGKSGGAVSAGRSRLDRGVFHYAAAVCLLLLLFSVGVSNISVHFAGAGVENYSVAAGFAAAVQMLGSAAFGLCGFSLALMYFGIAVLGMSMSILSPQCVLSVSRLVDESTSALAASLINSVAPGLGTFLSPMIITNATAALAGDSTGFRYVFTALLALLAAGVFWLLNRRRAA